MQKAKSDSPKNIYIISISIESSLVHIFLKRDNWTTREDPSPQTFKY